MKTLFSGLLLGLCFSFGLVGQESRTSFNFDFEELSSNEMPKDWITWGTYKIEASSEEKVSGQYSSKITSKENGEFGCVAYGIPSRYKGEEITLTGSFKTKAVIGNVGLLLRLDGKAGSLGFDNMESRNINGDNNWKEYSITLPYSEDVENIYVGGIIQGQGEAWFDNFELLIDGKSVVGMPYVEKPKTKADLDSEFASGSNISLDNLDQNALNNLNILGRVWGFVKYHHPEVAKGNHNMDAELFRILPAVTKADFKDQLFEWLQKFGDPGDEKALEGLELEQEPTTDWIHDEQFLSPEIVKVLEKLNTCKKEDEHYYLSFAKRIGNPSFDNEVDYPNMDTSDDGMRILSLFRFWNMVEYFFPYKYMTDQKWDEVFTELIPKMVDANDGLSYKLASLEMIKKVEDTHANIWMRDKELSKHHGDNGVPLEITFIEDQPVVTKIYSSFNNPQSKIKVGDIITEIDNRAILDVVKEKLKYCTASNEATMLRNVARRILRTNNTSINLSLENKDGKIFAEDLNTIPNREIKFWLEDDAESHRMLDGKDIGYIYPGKLKAGEIDEIMTKFKFTDGIVIDLRCYPSDFIVFSLGRYLMPQPTEFVKFTAGMLEKPGGFGFGETISNGEVNPDYYQGTVTILINEETQSQAEYTTMALRNAPKCTVIGSTTAGADGNVSRIALPGGINTMISGLGVYYPDGRETQRIGIIPDIELRPTISSIRNGEDLLLNKAIDIIEN